MLNAHALLMPGLLDAPGGYRRCGVAVMGLGRFHHVGPSSELVPQHTANLLAWLRSTDEHPRVASSVFHYEFEFIHPIEDSNGRMDRLWQSPILTRWKPLFAHIPVGRLIHAGQSDYYDAVSRSSAEGASTSFIALMPDVIVEALRPRAVTDQARDRVSDEESRLLAALRVDPKTAAQLMAELGLSRRSTFRNHDVRPAISAELVEMTRPESPTGKNQKCRLTVRRQAVR